MMKRIAIIIGNEGSRTSFLPGVSVDIELCKKFLLSNAGGAWENSEIVTGKNWTVNTLKSNIDRAKSLYTDYFLIIFTGHGYARRGEDTFFELSNDEEISYKKLKDWLFLKKSLIISDSCRKYISLLEKASSLESLRMFADSRSTARIDYRTLYDRAINDLPSFHHTFAASCDLDEYSNDSSEGGLYLKALIDAAHAIVERGYSGVYDIKSVHEQAAGKVSGGTRYAQNPKLYTDGTVTPPFVVIPNRWY